MTVLLSFLFGAVFGSFLNVLIDRLSTGRPFTTGRSYCEHCKKTLKIQDLIPLLSYALLKGRCRYCNARIPFRLFLVEAITGITAALVISTHVSIGVPFITAILLFVILFCFIGTFFADIEYGIIPDFFVALGTFATIFYIFTLSYSISNHLIAALSSFAFFLFLFLVTKGRGMGFGDVKLAFLLGLLLGFPLIIVNLYLAFLTGAGISIILVIWRKIRFFGGTIPFGPFLVVTAVITLFLGKNILELFLTSFF